MSRIFLCMGVTGSGKSTFGEKLARQLNGHFIEADDLHSQANKAKMSSGIPLTDADRAPWLDQIAQQAAKVSDGNAVVIACSALKKAYRDRLRQQLGNICIIHLKADKEALHSRLKQRQNHFMPHGMIESQFEALESPAGEVNVFEVDALASFEQQMDSVAVTL